MIYYDNDAQTFKVHTHTATYINTQDDVERVKHTSDKAYWEGFVANWGSNLKFKKISITSDQQARLDKLNDQDNCCGQWDYQASLFVEYGAILPHEEVPYLTELSSEYEQETLSWASDEYGREFETIGELREFLSNDF